MAVSSIRSGRFEYTRKDANPNAYSTHEIVRSPRGNALFRIFNSGDEPFHVLINGTSRATVYPTYSFDVIPNGKIEIQAAQDGGVAEGIYDFVTVSRDVRSGRFDLSKDRNYGTMPGDPTLNNPLKILDITDSNSNTKVYLRVYNVSDDTNIGIHALNANTTPMDSATANPANDHQFLLRPRQSIDLQISKNRGCVWVVNQASGEIINGIYEFLDIDE